MANALEIKDLCKDYGDFKLDNVSFNLPEGYIMGLIGPNGAGKTTIIKSIMNLIVNNTGQIDVFGMDHREHEVAVKKRIGFVYDSPNYYEHLNLNSIRSIIAPFYPQWDEAAFERLTDRFELPRKKAIRNYSRGMQMKAAIAIALSHHADLIVMDEPTSGLDPVSRRELVDLLQEIIQDEKRSVLFSTHITSDLEGIADFITFVLRGEVVFSESQDEIVERYAIVKGSNDLLGGELNGHFVGVRRTKFGFEALTANADETRREFGSDVVVDRASLEDIMYFTNLQ